MELILIEVTVISGTNDK